MLKYYILCLYAEYPSPSFNMIHRLSTTMYRSLRISEGVAVNSDYQLDWSKTHLWDWWGALLSVSVRVFPESTGRGGKTCSGCVEG